MISLRIIGRLPHGYRGVTGKIVRSMCNTNAQLVDVKVNDQTGVATVAMQRPPINGMNLDLLTALNNTLDELASNRSRGMILTSNLPTVFSGGLDILEFIKPTDERATAFWTALQDCWLKLYGSTFPTAAAINGHSPAGGCLLSMSCEYRVMVEGKYTIGLNETALGIAAPLFFQETLRQTIAPRIAEKALTLGTLFSVDDALKIGLIDETAKNKEDAINKCEMFIGKFAKISPIARSFSKLGFRKNTLKVLEDNREEDLQTFLIGIKSPATQKTVEKYLEALRSKK